MSEPVILVGHPAGVPRAQCNCACTEVTVAPSLVFPPATNTLWQIAPGLHRDHLPDGYELVFDSFGPARVYALNAPARDILNGFATPRNLHMIGATAGGISDEASACVRRLIDLELLHPFNGCTKLTPQPPDTLTAWLHATNACNLRCTYCYVGKSAEQMDEAVGSAALEAVFRSATRHDFRSVHLKYAGGEPTLNFALVKSLHCRALEMATGTRLALHESVLSNGVALTNAIVDYLRDEGIHLMISLDGLGQAHDAQRPFVKGRGSAAHVVRTIDRAIARGLRPDLSITVTSNSVADLPQVVAFALERGLRFNLNFVRDSDHAPVRLSADDQQRILDGVLAALAVIESRLPRERLIDGLVDRSSFHHPHTNACNAGQSYLVIDHRGRIAPCHMTIDRAVTNTRDPDPIHTLQSDISGFPHPSVDAREGCRECMWRYWCAGGCPLLARRVSGRTDTASPFCIIYKVLFPVVLRLEGLRLVKWVAPVA
ncbi:MAG: radical SAM protein [Chloroflexi bacterium]|nr:radical SAM protein [Chloroflexota bacterium]